MSAPSTHFDVVDESGESSNKEMDALSPFELLPQELVFKIIDFVPEAVLNLMAVSCIEIRTIVCFFMLHTLFLLFLFLSKVKQFLEIL